MHPHFDDVFITVFVFVNVQFQLFIKVKGLLNESSKLETAVRPLVIYSNLVACLNLIIGN